MLKLIIFMIFVVSANAFLWDRIEDTDTVGFPVDCVKTWGECIIYDGGSYKVEVPVMKARNGGTCDLKYEFGCAPDQEPVDCEKTWDSCRNGVRREIVIVPAKNGGSCFLRREACQIPVDCVKDWSQCRNGIRFETPVTPERNGGTCYLRREECGIECVKEWGDCINGVRREVIKTPARRGGKCTPRTRERCPVDCTKRWGGCVGEGPSSFRQEVVVNPARNGGKCDLRRETGCKPAVTRINCIKDWGECEGNGPTSVRKEFVVTPAKNGGGCELREEYGCRYEPIDCVKEWGKCVGVGATSTRVEEIITPARYGGKRCRPLRTETGCRKKPVDCVKMWSACTGKGAVSQRKEIVKTQARNGGKPCKDFKVERGCHKDPSTDDYADDTQGKETASLFLANFVSESADDSGSPKRNFVGSGARSLAFGVPPPVPGLVADEFEGAENLKKNCSEIKGKNGKVIAVGCDNVDNIDPDVKKDEEAKAKKSIRKGEKQPAVVSRRRRSTDSGANPVSKITTRDVLLYLDSSGSVGPHKFSILKEVGKAIVDVLCGRISLGKYRTRIAMGTFNARQLLSFPFSKTDSVDTVKNKIQAVGYDYVYSYQSCIRDALEFVLSDIYTETNGARDPSYAEGDMIIMTDGCANCDFDDGRGLQRAAYRLKLNKINVYAIGVGIDENCRKILQVLARGGRCFHFFFLDDWDVDVEQFLFRLKNPPKDRCLDKWEHPGINCLERP